MRAGSKFGAATTNKAPASLKQTAATCVTYLAAWLGVVEYAQLASGETLLVMGAGGGVGGGATIGKWR